MADSNPLDQHVHGITRDLVSLAWPIAKLDPLSGNPRRGDVDYLASSFERFGQRIPLVVRRLKRGRGTVIKGNHSLAAAKQLGWTHVAVVWEDDDEATAKAFAIVDNRSSERGTNDDAELAVMLAEIAEVDIDLLAATGYTEQQLAKMLNDASAVADDDGSDGEPAVSWALIVECDTEVEQAALFDRLESEGHTVRRLQ